MAMMLSTASGNEVMGLRPFDIVLDYRYHRQVAQASCLDDFDEGDELCPWVCSWGGEDLVCVVQDLLLAPVLYGNQDLSSNLLLLVDLFFSLVQISFSVFGVGRSWRGVDWLDRLYSDSFFFSHNRLQVGWVHESKGDCVDVPVDSSLLPSLMGSLEGVGGLDLTGFMGSLGKSLGVRDFEIGLSLLVQNVHGSHGFDGGLDPFDEREGLAA